MRLLPLPVAALAALAAAQAPTDDALAAVRVFFLRDGALWTCDGRGAQSERWSGEDVRVARPLELSPDGSQIVMPRSRTLTVLGRDGHRRELGAFDGDSYRQAWSPDQRTLVFGTRVGTAEGGLWIVDDLTTDAAPHRFTAEGSFDDHPCFSPDGRWLAVAACLEQEVLQGTDSPIVKRRSQLQIVDRATGRSTAACERTGPIDGIAWSPDGRWLAFRVARDLLVVEMAGGSPGPARALPARPRFGGVLAWRPDSTLLLADCNVAGATRGEHAHGPEDALLFVPLDGASRQVDLHQDFRDAAFDPSGDHVFVTCRDLRLHRVAVADGTDTTLPVEVEFRSPVWCRRR